MGRVAHIRMKITDFKIEDNKAIIAVEIRKGTYVFRQAYGMAAPEIKNFNMDEFKIRVYEDAQRMVADKEFEETVLRRIDDMIGATIELD